MTGYDSKMKDGEANKVECTLAPFEKYRQYECRRVGNVVTVKRRENDHRHLFFCLFVLPTQKQHLAARDSVVLDRETRRSTPFNVKVGRRLCGEKKKGA